MLALREGGIPAFGRSLIFMNPFIIHSRWREGIYVAGLQSLGAHTLPPSLSFKPVDLSSSSVNKTAFADILPQLQADMSITGTYVELRAMSQTGFCSPHLRVTMDRGDVQLPKPNKRLLQPHCSPLAVLEQPGPGETSAYR